MDPIADMLTRIRNAQAVGHKTASFPYSKVKFALAQILNSCGYLGAVRETERGTGRKIEVNLKYKDNKNKMPIIQELERISKSGQRIYVGKKELPGVSRGQGIVILTTSFGLMTDKDARKKGIGGEVICRVW
jgi:small subunit ribosomal protein S8